MVSIFFKAVLQPRPAAILSRDRSLSGAYDGPKKLMNFDLPSAAQPLKIGTRGSPLALAQDHETRARLMAAFDLLEDSFVVVVIKVTGDTIQDSPL